MCNSITLFNYTRGSKTKPAITVRLRSVQKTRWDKLNEITHTMKNTTPYNPNVIARKANYATALMMEHCNSIGSRTTSSTISITLIEKKVKDLQGFLKMKLNSEMHADVAPFVIDHFCEEISFLFLVATQEDSAKDSDKSGHSYVIWRPQANSSADLDEVPSEWRPPDPPDTWTKLT